MTLVKWVTTLLLGVGLIVVLVESKQGSRLRLQPGSGFSLDGFGVTYPKPNRGRAAVTRVHAPSMLLMELDCGIFRIGFLIDILLMTNAFDKLELC